MIRCKNECPLNKFDGCCFACELKETCEEACALDPYDCGDSIMEDLDEETALQVFQQGQMSVLHEIANIVNQKKKLESEEKQLKAKLQEAMEQYNIKKFESDVLNITYVAPTTTTSVDSTKLKKKYPDIYKECSKTSNRSAYITIKVK